VWTSPADIAQYLGGTVDPADPYLDTCADAADDFIRRRRLEAGYDDDRDPAAGPPSFAVGLGTTMYGGTLFRERGSADSYASFDETASFFTTGTWSRIKQLCGLGRGQVDAPLSTLPVVNPLGVGRRR
jgi:hypothetical protein